MATLQSSYYRGSGDPNGVLSATAGDFYARTAGTITLYVCQGGTVWSTVTGGADVFPQSALLTSSPTTSGWTDANTPVTAAITNPVAGIHVTKLGTASTEVARKTKTLGAATVITSRFRWTTAMDGFASFYPILLRESGTGKMAVAAFGGNNAAAGSIVTSLFFQRWTNDTTFGANFGRSAQLATGECYWYRIALSGGNIIGSYSTDGYNYVILGSLAITTAFTVAPDQYGVGANGNLGDTSTEYGGIVDYLLAA